MKLNFNYYIKLFFIPSLTLLTLGCGARDSLISSIKGSFIEEHDFIIKQKSIDEENPQFNSYTTPQIIIQPLNPIKCQGEANYTKNINGCILSQPLPTSLTLRYGKWLSATEEEKLFPSIPFKYNENQPNIMDYKSYEEWNIAHRKYWKNINNLPEFKNIEIAKQKSIENIDWHTITIYPQNIFNKYKNTLPKEKAGNSDINLPWLKSTQLILSIIVNPDMTVKLKEDYVYKQSSTPSYH